MSKVIKSGSRGNLRRAIVDADVFDAKLEGDRLLAEARAAGERELAAARDEAERLRRKAEVEGRERGLGAVTELLVGARAVAARARAGAEAELRALAVRIAEKILGRELTLNPDAVVDVAAEALRARRRAARAGGPLCNPRISEALERGKPRLIERCGAAQAVRFVADERVARGGCIIETELGVVDARLSTQLDAIERALRGEPSSSGAVSAAARPRRGALDRRRHHRAARRRARHRAHRPGAARDRAGRARRRAGDRRAHPRQRRCAPRWSAFTARR